MSPERFAQYIRIKTSTSATTLVDAKLLLLANVVQEDMTDEIVSHCGEDIFGGSAVADLVANQREYDLEADIVKIKFLQANLKVEASDPDNWKHLEEIDLNTWRQPTNEESIQAYYKGGEAVSRGEGYGFGAREPEFRIYGGSVFIYSANAIIDVTEGLELHGIFRPRDLTDLSSTADISEEPTLTTRGFYRAFHKLLAERTVIEYKSSRDKPVPLNDRELTWQDRFEEKMRSVKGMNLDRLNKASMPYRTGTEF